MTRLVLQIVVLAALAPISTSGVVAAAFAGEAALAFRSQGEAPRTLVLTELRRTCPEAEVAVDDPYHGRRMTYLALPLVCVLDQGFADRGGAAALRGEGLLLTALDGYTRPVAGRELLASGGFVAFAEAARLTSGGAGSRFSPIDRRQVDPGPFYLIWAGADQNDPHIMPWPYQLASIEIAPFAEAFPKTVPTGLASDHPGQRGYTLFQGACASCHSINGEGGKVGPDLNVPRSIVEYRPIDQIRDYIRDPQATRYTSMPAHPNLTEADLDALIAYFSAMSQRKQDSRVRGDG